MLDIVKLGELAAIRRDELIKLTFGLSAEVGAIDKKEDTLRAGVLDEAVSKGARREVLPAPVAIWIRARRCPSAKDFSKFVIASIWQSRIPSITSGWAKRSWARR